MQKIFISGFVGRDPEEKVTKTGKKLATFPLAVNAFKEGEKLCLWYKVNCWDGQCSSILPHIKKGSSVTVIGELNPPTTYKNKSGEIAIDMSVSCFSISFTPSAKPQATKEDESMIEQSFFDGGGIK